jgi:hypothetical protein
MPDQPKSRSERAAERCAKRAAAGLPVNTQVSKKSCRSLAVVAQLLDCEGFTEYHAQHIIKYAKQTSEHGKSFEKKHEAFKRAMGGAPEDMRHAIGKFISAHGEAHFAAGVRVGLMTLLQKTFTEHIDVTSAREQMFKDYRWMLHLLCVMAFAIGSAVGIAITGAMQYMFGK